MQTHFPLMGCFSRERIEQTPEYALGRQYMLSQAFLLGQMIDTMVKHQIAVYGLLTGNEVVFVNKQENKE